MTAVAPQKTEPTSLPFPLFSEEFWRIYDKMGRECRLALNPAQQKVEAAIRGQEEKGQPVRVRVLKYRQAGMSTYCSARCLWRAITGLGHTAISIADKIDLPQQWLRRCRLWLDQIGGFGPQRGATSANELWFDVLQSRYAISSAEGTYPGMGHTIRTIHCSEVASWRNPEDLLGDLLPALPPGPGTMVLQESTGRALGDWWYERYWEAKSGEEGYVAVFLPWFLQPEYRRDESEVLSLAASEKALAKVGVDNGQLAWRRWMTRTEFHGSEERFANQYPSNEEEAFLAGGVNIYTPEMVKLAQDTIREPVWRGDILVGANPANFQLVDNESGQLLVWQQPDHRYHYVLGADCQWGAKDTADFDVGYVECLETRKLCAKIKGRFTLGDWGKLLASLGHRYNIAVLAPERNTLAANSLMPLLLGTVSSWRYPNIYIRSDDIALRGHRPQDYGWLTNEHTKGDLLQYSWAATLDGEFDWCDTQCVRQMRSIVRREDNTVGAPDGMLDDDWMARLITAYVAHKKRMTTPLYIEKAPATFTFRTMQERVREDVLGDENGTV